MTRTLLISVMLSWSLLGESAVYTWTDEQGRVHFSDRPVDEESEQVYVTPSPTSSQPSVDQAERQRKRQRLLDVYREDRAKKQAQVEKQKQAKLEKQRKCRKAKRRHARFNHAGGIYDEDDRGVRHYMDEQERARFIAELQAEIERWCGK